MPMTKIPVLIDQASSRPREDTLGLPDAAERILDGERLRCSRSEFPAGMGVALIGSAKAGAKGVITPTFGV